MYLRATEGDDAQLEASKRARELNYLGRKLAAPERKQGHVVKNVMPVCKRVNDALISPITRECTVTRDEVDHPIESRPGHVQHVHVRMCMSCGTACARACACACRGERRLCELKRAHNLAPVERFNHHNARVDLVRVRVRG